MDTLRTWVLLLCGTSIAAAAVGVLLPQGQTKGAFRVLSGIVFLFALVWPLRQPALTEDWLSAVLTQPPQDASAFAAYEEQGQILAAEQLLEQQIRDALTRAGCRVSAVDVVCEAFSDGIAPRRITVRGQLQADVLQKLLQPYLTKHTEWQLLTED